MPKQSYPQIDGQPWTPTQTIVYQTRQLRAQRGWSANKLGTEMASLGVRWERNIVANLENGRRATVSVEEFLALAYVLEVAPVHLLVPTETPETDAFRLAPDREVPVERARAWVRGDDPLDTSARVYFTAVPDAEFIARFKAGAVSRA